MSIPPPPARPALLTRGPVRLWAAGSLLTVVVVLTATLVGRALALNARAAAARVSPPSLPLPDVAAVVPLGGQPRMVATDAAAGRVFVVVAVTGSTCAPEVSCQPIGSNALLLLGNNGSQIARVGLGGDPIADQARLLLCDQSTQSVFLIGPSGVARYSATSGAALGEYPLPVSARADDPAGAALGMNETLYLAGSWGLLALDEASGQVLARQTISPGHTLQGPVADLATHRLFVVTTAASGQAVLRAFDARTLAPLASAPLPPETRLGPLDPTGNLALFTASGMVWWLPASATPGPGPLPAFVRTSQEVAGARALGWDSALGHRYALADDGLTVETASGSALAALPLMVDWPSSLPLPVDSTTGLLYLPVAPETLLIVRDAAHSGHTTVDATQAAILARFDFSSMLPPADQHPPFIAAESFPPVSASQPLALWVYSSDLGWLGPYAGLATTQVLPRAGGTYVVDYTLTWQQLFARTHAWQLAVAANGAVRLVGDRGDALP